MGRDFTMRALVLFLFAIILQTSGAADYAEYASSDTPILKEGYGCGSDAETVHRVKTQILRAIKRQAVPEGTESVIIMVVDSLIPHRPGGPTDVIWLEIDLAVDELQSDACPSPSRCLDQSLAVTETWRHATPCPDQHGYRAVVFAREQEFAQEHVHGLQQMHAAEIEQMLSSDLHTLNMVEMSGVLYSATDHAVCLAHKKDAQQHGVLACYY